MALHLYLSNSLEILAGKFAENFSMAGRDPFETCYAVVPNSGMGGFLKRFLARRENQAIAANVATPFLQKFITDQICNFFTPTQREEFRNSMLRWSPELLSWRIDHILATSPEEFPEFTNYCANDPVRRHLLACELANSFDRCQFYRSTVSGDTHLQAWRSGRGQGGREKLYCKLCRSTPDPDSFFIRFFAADAPQEPLPEKVGIFGISTMAPLNLKCIKKFSQFTEIHLFCPSPCREYWGDLLSKTELLKELKKDSDAAFELLEECACSNQLLGDFGVSGREFFNLLLDEDCFTGAPSEGLFTEPGNKTALQLFQSDILNARPRNSASGNAFVTPPEDRSIRINCCTDSRRELEILHDQLLELFYGPGDKGSAKGSVKLTNALRPEDVIVMFPDINSAAPMIDAVFSNGPLRNLYAICDRSSAGQSQVMECFNRLLDLVRGRVSSEELLNLLEFDCLNTKLGIPVEALPELTDLVSRSRISWGLDEKEHQKFRQTPFTEFSWQDGIDRLLTEYARGEDISVIYAPHETGGIDGELAENFARLAEFTILLKEWRSQLNFSRTAKEWGDFMPKWINSFFEGGSRDYFPEINELKRTATSIALNAAKAVNGDPVIAPEVFISRLKSACSMTGGTQHFLRNKITFCSLVPLRAIPAKVIAILGLNDGAFPGIDRHNSFDLLAKVRRNDPNVTNEGRYLFLEALMAAREHLILSYVGFDNGSELAPAIPMAAVENVLLKGFGIEKSKIPLKALELDSLKEFRSDLPQEPASSEELPELALLPYPETMNIGLLNNILTRSCEAFFKLRCGFDFEKFEKKLPATDDPEKPDSLDVSTLQKALWTMTVAGIGEEQQLSLVKRGRILPVNGTEFFDEARNTIAPLEARFIEKYRSLVTVNCSVTLPCGRTLCGSVAIPSDLEKSQVRHLISFSKCSPEKLFQFHLEQLLLAAFFKLPGLRGELIFTKEEPDAMVRSFPPVRDAEKQLNKLLLTALHTWSKKMPLPLFANASLACCQGENYAKAFATDLRYNRAIGLFYDENNYDSGRFKRLAKRVYAPVAEVEVMSL